MSKVPRLAIVVAVAALAGCDWVSLAANAANYAVIQRGETANLVVRDTLVYASRAEDGLAVLGLASGRPVDSLVPAAGSESVDDLAIDGALLFVLDARIPGHLSVYSLADPAHPRLVSPPREVPVGPFSGVSAAAGICLVSGGTSSLTAWRYDSAGTLSGPVGTADLGRGQPDVLLSRDGALAFVSTHYWGVSFGLDVVRLGPGAGHVDLAGKLGIDGAGFTEGGAKPANFPIETAELGRDTVLVAHARGVAVVDATAPDRPALLERVDVGGPAVSVDVQGRRAAVAVAGPAPSLVILDFEGGRARVGRRIALPPGAHPTGVAITTSRVAVAARGRGVLVFDL